MSKTKITLIVLVWLLWGGGYYFGQPEPINHDLIKYKSGSIISAECLNSRSIRGIEIKVYYDDAKEAEEDFINTFEKCKKNNVTNYIGKEVRIAYFENYYLEVSVGNENIINLEDSLAKHSDGVGSVFHLYYFVAVLLSILILLRMCMRSEE